MTAPPAMPKYCESWHSLGLYQKKETWAPAPLQNATKEITEDQERTLFKYPQRLINVYFLKVPSGVLVPVVRSGVGDPLDLLLALNAINLILVTPGTIRNRLHLVEIRLHTCIAFTGPAIKRFWPKQRTAAATSVTSESHCPWWYATARIGHPFNNAHNVICRASADSYIGSWNLKSKRCANDDRDYKKRLHIVDDTQGAHITPFI